MRQLGEVSSRDPDCLRFHLPFRSYPIPHRLWLINNKIRKIQGLDACTKLT